MFDIPNRSIQVNTFVKEFKMSVIRNSKAILFNLSKIESEIKKYEESKKEKSTEPKKKTS